MNPLKTLQVVLTLLRKGLPHAVREKAVKVTAKEMFFHHVPGGGLWQELFGSPT